MQKTVLSIITITHNNPKLKQTLDSVGNQIFKEFNIEHIIVDNLSTDMTQYIVKEYKKHAPYPVIYIRESDTGRYQAMNKGIKMATGEYLLFLNAGDKLHNNLVLSQVFKHDFDNDLIYGDIQGKSLKSVSINEQFFIDQSLFHQATFIKKSLFHKYGLYDESLIISSDFDFFIKTILVNKVTPKYIPLIIADYEGGGISSTGSDLVYGERAKVLTRYLNGNKYFYHLLKYFYYKNKKFIPKIFVDFQKQRLANKPKI